MKYTTYIGGHVTVEELLPDGRKYIMSGNELAGYRVIYYDSITTQNSTPVVYSTLEETINSINSWKGVDIDDL